MTTVHVTAERFDKWWVLQCVEYPGAISQVRRLEQAADEIREAIAWVAELPEDDLDIEVVPLVPDEFTQALERIQSLRKRADAARAEAAVANRAVATGLARAGYSARDIGTLMGVSFQRAAQLAAV
ncbi:MAG: hypothetical protein LBC29_00525 [Propionibacteriaceae bacterium]|nr:hypothetical protein [Propionibacteriaceae bacterium]